MGLTKPEDVSFPLRWGIIGGGEISRQFVLSSRACPGAIISAVATRSLETAQSFANSYGVDSAYGNIEDMLASDDVDIVYVGTPDEMHKQHSLLAIEAGKHVLCEKILAKSVVDAEEM